MNVRRFAALIALPVAFVTGVTACGSSTPDTVAGDPSGGAVTIGIAEPEHLVPTDTVENNGSQILAALFTQLVNFDDHGRPDFSQAAAQSITSTDSRVWTIALKDGFTFHNGERVTADSYINAWNYGAYEPHAQVGSDFFARIEGADQLRSRNGKDKPAQTKMSGLKKVDDLTFTVTLKQPFAEWQKVLGYSVFLPLPAAAFAGDGTLAKGYEEAPIGDGPFKMKGAWNHNQSISVERYEAYPLTKPKVQEIDFKIYDNQDTMYADLQAGNLDIQPQLPSDKLAGAQIDLGDRMQKSPSSYIGYITIPENVAAFQDPKLRRAISMAIDRQEIVDKIFQGAYTPATGWVSPIVQGARDNSCGDACKFNPTQARTLYQQSGGLPGNKIDLYYNGDGAHKEWVDAVCNQLHRNLALTCTGQPVPQFADFRKKVRAHTLPGLIRGAWSFDYPSIEDYLTPIFKTGASSNDSQYNNPAFNQLLAKADEAKTPDEAINLYQQAEDLIARDMPTIPMWFRQNITGYSENIKTVNVDLFAQVDVLTLERT